MAARVLILIPIVLVVAQSTEAQQVVNEGASPPSYGQAFLDGALIGDDYSRAGFGLAAGVDLPRRLALHVEAEIPMWYSVRDVGRGSTGALELNYSTRTSAYAVLLGRRFGANPRVHLDEVVAIDVLHRGIELVPHSRFDGAATIAELEAQISLAFTGAANLFFVNEEKRSNGLFGIEVGNEGRLHVADAEPERLPKSRNFLWLFLLLVTSGVALTS